MRHVIYSVNTNLYIISLAVFRFYCKYVHRVCMTDRHVKCNKSVIVTLCFLKNNHHYLYQVLRILVCKPIINDFAFKVTEAEMFSIVTLFI